VPSLLVLEEITMGHSNLILQMIFSNKSPQYSPRMSEFLVFYHPIVRSIVQLTQAPLWQAIPRIVKRLALYNPVINVFKKNRQ